MQAALLDISKIKTFYQNNFRGKVEYKEVLADVKEDGLFTYRFAFFCVVACAIATLGLLLNSPAVIIGAMLISPLMGPIVMQGFSLSLVDAKMFRKSTVTIFSGASLAVAISVLIVLLSPITEANDEILARTSPNLFDLLIAVLSGLAAGYTFIKRRGAAIVGVAIATSLMIPLAVMGFGIATGSLWISEGAFYLFMTNLLAISLSVSFVSKLYGFGASKDSQNLLRHTLIAFTILLVLSIPLGISLKNIAFEAYAVSKAKTIIMNFFPGKLSRLSDFSISLEKDYVDVDAVVITKIYDPQANEAVKKELEERFQMPVKLGLVQIALKNDLQLKDHKTVGSKSNSALKPSSQQPKGNYLVDDLKSNVSKLLWFSAKFIEIDPEKKKIYIFANYEPDITLNNLHRSEETLTTQFPGWKIFIYPSQQHLPSLYFDNANAALDDKNRKLLDDIMWALQRWDVQQVDVIGYASSTGNKRGNDRISYQRAENVAKILKENGVTVYIKGRSNFPYQNIKEKHKGLNSYQRVDVRLHYDTQVKEKHMP